MSRHQGRPALALVARLIIFVLVSIRQHVSSVLWRDLLPPLNGVIKKKGDHRFNGKLIYAENCYRAQQTQTREMDRKGYFLGLMQTHQATVVWWMFKYVPPPRFFFFFFALEVMFWETEKNVLGGDGEKKKGGEEINFIAKVTWKILEELKTVSS